MNTKNSEFIDFYEILESAPQCPILVPSELGAVGCFAYDRRQGGRDFLFCVTALLDGNDDWPPRALPEAAVTYFNNVLQQVAMTNEAPPMEEVVAALDGGENREAPRSVPQQAASPPIVPRLTREDFEHTIATSKGESIVFAPQALPMINVDFRMFAGAGPMLGAYVLRSPYASRHG